jgi:HTH-type transcriptional regulator/antitoxin HigA
MPTTTESTPHASDIRPIRNDADLRRALEVISTLLDAPAGTPAADVLDVLSTLVESYEREHHPIEPPTAVEAVRFRMDQGSLTRKDLEPLLGGRSHVSEFLAGKRALPLKARRELHERFGIPAESLLR